MWPLYINNEDESESESHGELGQTINYKFVPLAFSPYLLRIQKTTEEKLYESSIWSFFDLKDKKEEKSFVLLRIGQFIVELWTRLIYRIEEMTNRRFMFAKFLRTFIGM